MTCKLTGILVASAGSNATFKVPPSNAPVSVSGGSISYTDLELGLNQKAELDLHTVGSTSGSATIDNTSGIVGVKLSLNDGTILLVVGAGNTGSVSYSLSEDKAKLEYRVV